MGIVVEKTKDRINKDYPAVNMWLPCKEGNAITLPQEVSDYAGGRRLITTGAAINGAVANAVRAGNVAGETFQNYISGVATHISIRVEEDEHLIAICAADNLEAANAYLGFGRINFNDTLVFTETGTPYVRDGGVTVMTGAAAAVGTQGLLIGLDRDRGRFYTSSVLGSAVTAETQRDAFTGVLDFEGGPSSNGMYIGGNAGGATPLALYSVAILKFRGNYPDFNTFISPTFLSFVMNARVGIKALPGQWKNLRA